MRGAALKIRSISAYQVYDSRGNPTVEAEIELESGERGRGTVPSGASTGQFEALELRDGNPARFRGKSVFNAIANIHREIAPALIGSDVRDQASLDRRAWLCLAVIYGTRKTTTAVRQALADIPLADVRTRAEQLLDQLHTRYGRSVSQAGSPNHVQR